MYIYIGPLITYDTKTKSSPGVCIRNAFGSFSVKSCNWGQNWKKIRLLITLSYFYIMIYILIPAQIESLVMMLPLKKKLSSFEYLALTCHVH